MAFQKGFRLTKALLEEEKKTQKLHVDHGSDTLSELQR